MERRALATVVALVLASAASAAGAAASTASYAYAGVSSLRPAYGVGARITLLEPPHVATGHIAAWVGVGGYGLGPDGSSEWLQVGISILPGGRPALYYELARPGRAPRYVMLDGDVDRSVDVAVLETPRRGWWRVWVAGTPVTKPLYLAGSDGAWRPVATAESWDSARSGFAFEFERVRTAAEPGGAWQPLQGSVLADPGYRVLHRSPVGFVAAHQ